MLSGKTDPIPTGLFSTTHKLKKDVSETSSRSSFSSKQDVAIAREVAAAKALIAASRERRKTYQCAAWKLDSNSLFAKLPIAWKQVQNRYRRLQDFSNTRNKDNERHFRVGGVEIGELVDFLTKMREDCDEMVARKNVARNEQTRREEEEEEVSRRIVAAATL